MSKFSEATEKHRGYCFECHAEFETDDVGKPCPNCGSGDWVLRSQLELAPLRTGTDDRKIRRRRSPRTPR